MNHQEIGHEPLISVLMPAYQEDLILFQEALDSILSQTYKKLEIILIIDDPSNTKLINQAQKTQRKDQRIKLYTNPQNIGLARTLNRAISLAAGEYCCRMDSDDLSRTDRIEQQLSYLLKNNLDLVGSYLQVINEDGKALYYANTIPLTPDTIKKGLRWNNCIPHPSWLGKKKVFEQRYRLIDFCEDYDFLLRSQLAGFSLGNINEPLVSYRMTPNSISRSNLYSQYLSQCYLTKKYKKGEIANLKEMQTWIARKSKDNKARAYAKSNAYFNDALLCLSSGKLRNAVINGIRVIGSPAYLNKICRMAFAALFSK